MMRIRTLGRSLGTGLAAAALAAGWGAATASAEPIFLSKQYPRCTACHYSPSGGGLLTPYGRSLSREEISTFGRRGPAGAALTEAPRSEESFLFGALGSDSPLQLGLDIRPSHLGLNVPGRAVADRNFLMNLDLQAAWQRARWTAYGSVGRKPTGGGELVSYEHWVAYQASDTLSVRGGRFLPAYGVRFADHTSFTREGLDLAQDDQVYGLEVGVSTDRSLLQLSVGPGRADSLVTGSGQAALTASGRFQVDLSPRTVVVGSMLYRGATDVGPRSTDTGVSFGYAPARWLTTWTHADLRLQRLAASDRSYIVANQTSVEAWRGVWLRVSPQVRWTAGDPRGEVRRMVYGLDFYPRTHWHVNLSWYRDHRRVGDLHTQALLAQLHLYL